jgi:hypothetical protein
MTPCKVVAIPFARATHVTPRVTPWLVAVCWLVLSGPLLANDEQILHAAGIAADDRSLLDFFRKQTADAATLRQARQLIDHLGSDSFPVREQAGKDLLALGPAILPLLRQTIHETHDLEVRRRARDAVEQLQRRSRATVAAAAARLLRQQQPFGTAETLLAFLPGPYDESVGEEIQITLLAVAQVHREVCPSFVRALASAVPEQRTTAAVVLCRLDARGYGAIIRKLLHDRDAGVRLHVASELVFAGDRQAVPVLIELLAQLPVEQAEQAEELLYRLAGAKAPLAPLGHDTAAKRKCRDAWRGWWRNYGERVEMAALQDGQRQLGYTLLVLLNANRVVEWDRDGKPRWQIAGLASPLDAEVLPGSRVLIAEHDNKRVSERNFKGEVLWEKKLSEPPIHAERLPDGRTFIATRKRLLEVDRSGAEIVRYRSRGELVTARRYRDGRIACIVKGSYVELNRDGDELRRFSVPDGVCTTNSLTLLPNGHLLIVAYGGGTVQEYDRGGKIGWQIQLSRPLCAVRLPNGNTLVSSQDMVVIEYDRSGKEIARRAAEGHPCQIRRR